MARAWPRGPRNNLHRAAKNGSVTQVRDILASGSIDINLGDPWGATPLVFAIEHHPCIVEILIKAGANVNIPGDRGATALHWSVTFGQLCTTRMLIEAGARLEAINDSGCTPLQLAGEFGHAEVIRALLEAGANVDSRSAEGETALYSAAYHGHVEATKELLGADANPGLGTVSGDGITQVTRLPVDVAAQRGHEGVVVELLQLGIDACGATRGDALVLASKRQHLGTMATLKDAGVVDDGVALLTATSYRCEEAVKFLLSQHWAAGARRLAYVNFHDQDGRTPLLIAAAGESPRITRMLLDAGAKSSSPGVGKFENMTPLTVTQKMLEFESTAETHATKEKRHRRERLRRLLLRVDAISAVSWLWPSGAHCTTGATEAVKSVSNFSRVLTARLLRWVQIDLPFRGQLLLS